MIDSSPHLYKSNPHSHLFGTASEISKKDGKIYLPDKYFFPSAPDASGGVFATVSPTLRPQPHHTNLPLRTRPCGVDLVHPHPFEPGKSGLLNEETVVGWVDEGLGGHEGVSQ